MKDKLLFLTIGLFFSSVLFTGSADAQIRLSFTGVDPTGSTLVPLTTFDETIDTAVEICLPCLLEDDGEYTLRGSSRAHVTNGWPGFPNTETPGGVPWTIVVYLEPGPLVVHIQAPHTSGNGNFVNGTTWDGKTPGEFTHLSIVLFGEGAALGSQISGWVRTLTIPIVWTSPPVPTEGATWGGIKAMYAVTPADTTNTE